MEGEEKKDKVEEACALLEELTNVYGCRTNLERIALKMTSMHKTLVQSFTSGFVLPFVREMARLRAEDCFDDRNRMAVEACEAMSNAIDEKYGTKPGDRVTLPLI